MKSYNEQYLIFHTKWLWKIIQNRFKEKKMD